MLFPVKHRTVFWISLLVLTVSMVIIWLFYFHVIRYQNLYIKREGILCAKTMDRRQKIENIYIAKGFILKTKFIDAIEREDIALLEKSINEISRLSFYDGAVILKDDKIVYKTESAPFINYFKLIPYATKYPHKVYTCKVKKELYGYSIFSPMVNTDKQEVKKNNMEVILYFRWRNFLDRLFYIVNGLEFIFSDKEPKENEVFYPLLDVENTPVAYLLFRPSSAVSHLRVPVLFILIFTSIIMFIFFLPWIVYIWKEKEAISVISKAIGQSLKGVSLEYTMDLALKTLYTHKVYQKALDVAINTKSVKETLRALADTFSETVEARYWAITLFSYDVSKWRFLLWSFGIDARCLDEVLSFMKKEAPRGISKMSISKEVLFFSDFKNIESLKKLSCLSQYNIESAAIIPMIVKSETIGFLILAWEYKKTFDTQTRLIFKDIMIMIERILENTYNLQDMFWLSFKDPLLDIYNRRILDTISEKEYEGMLLYLDLDNFKRVNDTYGHEEGDKVLKEFVSIIRGIIRRDDLFMRYGGDEFLLFLKNTSEDVAKQIAKRIKDSIKEHFKRYGVTVSVGMTKIGEKTSLYEKIAEAEQLMYNEKRMKKLDGRLKENNSSRP